MTSNNGLCVINNDLYDKKTGYVISNNPLYDIK